MTKTKRRADFKQFSVSFPVALIEEIETICKTNYINRSSWLITAAMERIANERFKKIEQFKSMESGE